MNRAVYRRLLASYGRVPSQWLGWILELASSLCTRVWAVIIMAQATADVAAGSFETAQRQVMLFFIVYSVGFILGAVGVLVVMYSGNIQYRVQTRLYYDKLTGKDMSFYRDHQTGYVISMFRQYVDTLVTLPRFLINEVTGTVVSLTVPVVVLLFVDLRVGLIATAIVITQVVYIMWSSSRVTEARLAAHEAYRRVTAGISDILTNIVAFKASGSETQARRHIMRYSRAETLAYWLRYKTVVLYDLPRSLLTVVGLSLAFYFAIDSAASGPVAVGALVLTLTYMFQIMRNVIELPNLLMRHDDLVSKLYPTLKYLDEDQETIKDPAQPVEIPKGPAEIALRDVSFAYAGQAAGRETKVFDGLSLDITPGQQVGVVGLSGAGKSTLAGLLMRFDEVDKGVITINGVDIRSVRQTDLRQAIAYVPQEPLLFHRSIRENIAYFMDDVSDDAVERAARAAHAHEFVVELPDGYDTMVGERGIKLSGGQKQRVAIARAILKDAPIILFDEATSALDSESEAIIQRALPEILGKRTALIIAHRLSTVAGLDRIIVLERGKIVEDGTHDELLELGGRYAKLWHRQTRELTAT